MERKLYELRLLGHSQDDVRATLVSTPASLTSTSATLLDVERQRRVLEAERKRVTELKRLVQDQVACLY